jgi:hypothetical protein
MKRTFVALVPAFALSLVLGTQAGFPQAASYTATAVLQPPFQAAVQGITAAQLEDYLGFVASDEMEGRMTPSRGLDTVARFLVTLLSRWGLKPGGDAGSYFQAVDLVQEKLLPEHVGVTIGTRALEYGRDFLAVPRAGEASGGLIFAGDGWYVESKGRDPYEAIDPKGKIVVVTLAAVPPGVTREELASGGRQGEDWLDPVAYAEKRGAAGVIVLPTSLETKGDSMTAVRRRLEGGEARPEKLPRRGRWVFGGGPGSLPMVHLATAAAAALFEGEKVDAATILRGVKDRTPVAPFELSAQKQARISVKTAVERIPSQNVVAIVEGSDPTLKADYVAFGAHYDHSGVREVGDGDRILNGADDDGSGTVALLAMAEALQKAPSKPKRSAIFVWHMGEEKGLWGSAYFTAFPTVPLERIVAQLNIDMIGRSRAEGDNDPRNRNLSGPNEVYVIGSRMMSTELGAISDAVNAAYGKLSYNYRYDDPKDPERFFYRSDHIHYARKGIPIIFYFTGVHADYHQPGDEVSKIDFAKYERITRTIFATFWEIAERKARPVVDRQLPGS